ncbi:MAG: hypothetical protein HY690_09775, partial [Chloroflexi bacterium]|nr:hypothetical protein [Chloroflexota bacterium]
MDVRGWLRQHLSPGLVALLVVAVGAPPLTSAPDDVALATTHLEGSFSVPAALSVATPTPGPDTWATR